MGNGPAAAARAVTFHAGAKCWSQGSPPDVLCESPSRIQTEFRVGVVLGWEWSLSGLDAFRGGLSARGRVWGGGL